MNRRSLLKIAGLTTLFPFFTKQTKASEDKLEHSIFKRITNSVQLSNPPLLGNLQFVDITSQYEVERSFLIDPNVLITLKGDKASIKFYIENMSHNDFLEFINNLNEFIFLIPTELYPSDLCKKILFQYQNYDVCLASYVSLKKD